MKHVIGKCPDCGGEVIEYSKFYGCRNWRPIDGACPFTLPKKFVGREISPALAGKLLRDRYTERLGGFVSRKGFEFSASMELQTNGKKWRLQLRFTE